MKEPYFGEIGFHDCGLFCNLGVKKTDRQAVRQAARQTDKQTARQTEAR